MTYFPLPEFLERDAWRLVTIASAGLKTATVFFLVQALTYPVLTGNYNTRSNFDHTMTREIKPKKPIIDWSGRAEPRLVHQNVPFKLVLLANPTTDDRLNPLWVAELTVGEACHT